MVDPEGRVRSERRSSQGRTPGVEEELGRGAPDGEPVDLGEIRQKSGKLVRAWGLEGSRPDFFASNMFEVEWPPRSGEMREFPEVDRAGWFTLERAREKLNPAQVALLDRLVEQIG